MTYVSRAFGSFGPIGFVCRGPWAKKLPLRRETGVHIDEQLGEDRAFSPCERVHHGVVNQPEWGSSVPKT